jgi:hypothetical protein
MGGQRKERTEGEGDDQVLIMLVFPLARRPPSCESIMSVWCLTGEVRFLTGEVWWLLVLEVGACGS